MDVPAGPHGLRGPPAACFRLRGARQAAASTGGLPNGQRKPCGGGPGDRPAGAPSARVAEPGAPSRSGLERASLAAREAMQRTTAAEIERLEQHLTSLATLGNISPFVGLFGTVIGIMRAFEAISRTGSGGLASVSAGIAEALVATAAGLFVAIPAVIAYNYFVSRVKTHATEMDAAASELTARFVRAALAQTNGGRIQD